MFRINSLNEAIPWYLKTHEGLTDLTGWDTHNGDMLIYFDDGDGGTDEIVVTQETLIVACREYRDAADPVSYCYYCGARAEQIIAGMDVCSDDECTKDAITELRLQQER